MSGGTLSSDFGSLAQHLDLIGTPAALLGPERIISWANDTLAKMLAAPPEELCGQPFVPCLSSRCSRVLNFYDKQIFQYRCPVQGELWFRLDLKTHLDGEIAILSDVTAEQLQLQHLKFTSGVHDQLMDDAQIGIWRFDPDTQTYYFSATLSLGYPSTGRTISLANMHRLLHPGDIEQERYHRNLVVQDGLNTDGELRYRNVNGQWIHHHIFCRAGRRKPSGLFEMYGTSLNITPQAIARDESEKQAYRLKMALMAAKAIVFEYDYQRRTYWASEELATQIGVHDVSKLNDPPMELFADADHEEIGSLIRNMGTGAKSGGIDARVKTPEGERWCRLYMETYPDPDPGEHRAIGLMIDIDDQKRQALALEEARKVAESGAAAKSNFLAAMSHEIRTPLNGVLGMAQSLESDPLSEVQREKVGIILESGNTLMALLNDVLDLSKIEAGRLDIVPVENDLRSTVQRVISLFRPAADEKHIELTFSLPSEIPMRMSYDPVRVRQCVSNLLSNAIKFTEAGGRVAVKLGYEQQGDDTHFAIVEISDSGIGMNKETLDKLFSAFSQADASTSRRFGGTGLGLAISRQLAKLMGGDISVKSQLGSGSVFTLKFCFQPIEEPPRISPEKSSSATSTNAPPDTDSSEPNILLADDNPVNRQIIKLFLAPLNIRLTEAENGVQALQALRSQAFELVLLDVHMPIMNGCETIRAIRSKDTEWSDIPVIALTADAMSGDRERYLALGMSDYIAKPIDQRELIAKVSALLAKKRHSGSPQPEAINQKPDSLTG